MDSLRPPRELSFTGNVAENWRRFKQRFELYMIASGASSQKDDVKVAILLHVLGEEALEKFNTFDLNNVDKAKYASVIAAFENFCVPKSNQTVDRYLFFTRVQKDYECFDDFLVDLKKLSSTCGFENLRDSLIRDRIICGISNTSLKDRLLREGDLTLEKCVDICKVAELAEAQIKTIGDNCAVQSICNNGKQGATRFSRPNYQRDTTEDSKMVNETRPTGSDWVKSCRRCGSTHQVRQCPAFNLQCTTCKKKGHYAKMCRSNRSKVSSVQSSGHLCDAPDSDEDQQNVLFCGQVDMNNNGKDWLTTILINDVISVYMKLDSGAQCNVIPISKYKLWNLKNTITKCSNKLRNYDNSNIKVIGECMLKCQAKNGNVEMLMFHVVDLDNVPAILGSQACEKLQLIKRVDTIDENEPYAVKQNSFLFKGLGEIKNFVYDMKLKKDARPTVEHVRRIPVHVQDAFKNELQRMVDMHVIEEVTEPTEWVNAVVTVKKPNGKIRICLDPKNLNDNVLREHFYIPTFEEIACQMSGATIFSILDATQAFWQIKLSEESSKLTTFNTPYGRFRFLRLPYGICSAPEIFHRCFSQIFRDIPGVVIYIDDLLIYAKDDIEHDMILEKVLQRAKENGIRFNAEKSKFRLREVKYMGHTFSEKGLQPDVDKVRAILAMEEPTNVKSLESFLGMVTYISKFIPSMSQITAPLRQLVKKDVDWSWGDEQTKSFKELKNVLASEPVLKFFDPNKPVILSVDASKDGLGAVLLQENQPVAYASKALNSTQQNYAQIEKETLAILFGCERFHQYLFGKKFFVESDHKPLASIFRKSLYDCPARLQRMRIRLLKYDLHIVYKPGKDLHVADALSRLYLNDFRDNFQEEVELQVCALIGNNVMITDIYDQIKEATGTDPALQGVSKLIIEGWPENKKSVPTDCQPYYNIKDDLFLSDGLLYKNNRVIIPYSFRKKC